MNARFPSTHWSLIVAATAGSEDVRREALEAICLKYWRPLYLYARLHGNKHEDAEDLIQEFFVRLLRRDDLAKPNETRGRLRNYLLVALKHFMITWHRQSRTQARWPGQLPLSLDDVPELVDHDTPERCYTRQWAVSLLEHATRKLADDYAKQDKTPLFEALAPFLAGEPERGLDYRDTAKRLGTTEGTLRVALFRLRRRHRERFKEEILETLESPDAFEEERRFILRSLEL